MKESEPYEFDFLGGDNNVYIFTVQRGHTYEAKFKPSGYLFDSSQPFVDSIFEMVLLPVNPGVGQDLPLDAKTQPTVIAIVSHFFTQKERVLLYVCENKDGKGAARNRKFNQWFSLYNLDNHFKFDFVISNGQERYLNSVIGRIDNPYRAEVTLACFELAENNSK